MSARENGNAVFMDAKSLRPFALVGAAWVALGAIFCWKTSSPPQIVTAIRWMFELSLLCLVDLLALAKLFANVLEKDPQNRFFSAIRASYWGAIKIACFLLFGTILLKARSLPTRIPANGLITGASTLVVVPLLGGLIWHLIDTKSPEEIA